MKIWGFTQLSLTITWNKFSKPATFVNNSAETRAAFWSHGLTFSLPLDFSWCSQQIHSQTTVEMGNILTAKTSMHCSIDNDRSNLSRQQENCACNRRGADREFPYNLQADQNADSVPFHMKVSPTLLFSTPGSKTTKSRGNILLITSKLYPLQKKRNNTSTTAFQCPNDLQMKRIPNPRLHYVVLLTR